MCVCEIDLLVLLRALIIFKCMYIYYEPMGSSVQGINELELELESNYLNQSYFIINWYIYMIYIDN